jgi:hypothetical protein
MVALSFVPGMFALTLVESEPPPGLRLGTKVKSKPMIEPIAPASAPACSRSEAGRNDRFPGAASEAAGSGACPSSGVAIASSLPP